MNRGIAFLVVLYGRDYSESVAITTILAAFDSMRSKGYSPKLYVWNNSPKLSRVLSRDDVVWLSGQNCSLSVVYNTVAKVVFEGGVELLMLSDDDTDYASFDFISSLCRIRDVSSEDEAALGCFIPRIFSNNRLVSPGKRFFFKGSLLNDVRAGKFPSKNLLAINSGTFITKSCYEKMSPLYDERLNFYGTDTDFFIRYQRFYKYIYVIDSSIVHSLSSDTNESPERVLFRWRENIEAMSVVFENESLFIRFLMRAYYSFVKFKLFIRFKDWRFLKI